MEADWWTPAVYRPIDFVPWWSAVGSTSKLPWSAQFLSYSNKLFLSSVITNDIEMVIENIFENNVLFNATLTVQLTTVKTGHKRNRFLIFFLILNLGNKMVIIM